MDPPIQSSRTQGFSQIASRFFGIFVGLRRETVVLRNLWSAYLQFSSYMILTCYYDITGKTETRLASSKIGQFYNRSSHIDDENNNVIVVTTTQNYKTIENPIVAFNSFKERD